MTVGVLYTFFNLGFTISQVFGGYLADRFGRKVVIAWPTFHIAFFYLAIPFSKGWFLASFFCFLSFVASAIQWPAFTAMLGESSEKRGAAFGRFEFFLGIGLGVGPLLGSFFVSRIGIKGIIFGSTILTFIAAIWRIFGLVETSKTVKDRASNFDLKGSWDSKKGYIPFLIIGSLIFMALGLTVNGPFLTLFHGEVLGHTRSEINRLFAYGNLIGAIFVLFAGRLSDEVGAKKVLYLGIVLHTLLVVTWALTRYSILFVVSIPFVQWVYLAYQIVLVKITREKERGKKVGLFGTITGGLGSLSPLLGSAMKRSIGDLSPFYGALLFALFSLIPSKKVQPGD